MKHLSTILILFMISFTPSLAQESAEERLNEVIGIQELAKELKTLKQGWGAYKLGDYEDAFSIWMPLAETGNPSAQVFIGLLYNQGHGVIKDINEAVKWYSLASEQGHTPAKWRLAILYHHGDGLIQNYQKATDLYHSAAKQGDVYSQKSLGFMYSKGFGVPKDNILAYSWFHIANNNGLELAQKYQKKLADKMTPEETQVGQAIAKECLDSNYKKCGWTSGSEEETNTDSS